MFNLTYIQEAQTKITVKLLFLPPQLVKVKYWAPSAQKGLEQWDALVTTVGVCGWLGLQEGTLALFIKIVVTYLP